MEKQFYICGNFVLTKKLLRLKSFGHDVLAQTNLLPRFLKLPLGPTPVLTSFASSPLQDYQFPHLNDDQLPSIQHCSPLPNTQGSNSTIILCTGQCVSEWGVVGVGGGW